MSSLVKLVISEIKYRKSGFILSFISIAAATSVIIAAATIASARSEKTDDIISVRQEKTDRQMWQLRDDYRRFMKDMGHNSVVLHKDQSINDFLASGVADVYMPEVYVYKLSESERASYNHLLPVLARRTNWQQYDIEIILAGTSGQVPVMAKPRFWDENGYLDPIQADIPGGSVNIGAGLAQELDLKQGQKVSLYGEEFVINKINPPQDGFEDITVWCCLKKVQNWFDKQDKINAIYALECMGDAPPLGGIINHVPRVLPDTNVLQFEKMVSTRFQARTRASQATSTARESDKQHEGFITAEYASFNSILIPVVLAASGLIVFFQFLSNTRQRRQETAILRAIGLNSRKISVIFIIKAVFAGVLGSVIGSLIGLAAGIILTGKMFLGLSSIIFIIGIIIAAAAVCIFASWLPARYAVNQDPAKIISKQ